MHSVLQRADRFQDLPRSGTHDTPYRFDSIFEDESWWDRLRSRKKFKLLRRIDEALRDLLEEDEEVLFLTHGNGASGLEAYFLGWFLYVIYRRAIVLTDRRILFLQINSRNKPGELRSHLRYSAIAVVDGTLLGRARFELRNGKKEVLGNAPRKDAKHIRKLVGRLRAVSRGRTPVASGVEQLCPHCYAVVEGRPQRCSRCQGAFRSARKAGGLSLLFPGLGDFYLGHRGFAVVEMLSTVFIWLVVWASVVTASADGAQASASEMLIVAGFVFTLVHGFDALATWHIGRKAIHPGEKPTGRWSQTPGAGISSAADARSAPNPGSTSRTSRA